LNKAIAIRFFLLTVDKTRQARYTYLAKPLKRARSRKAVLDWVETHIKAVLADGFFCIFF